MARRRLTWLVAFCLAAAGAALTHALAYELLFQGGAHAGHARGGHWGLCLGVCGTLALVGFAVFGARRPPLWVFALLPPIGFALQEQLTWALTRGSGLAGLGVTLLLGSFIQVPFALAAYLAARGLLRLAAALGRGRRPRPRLRSALPCLRPRSIAPRPLSRRGLSGLGQRAPPVWARTCPN